MNLSYEQFNYIFYIGLVLAGIFFVLTIVLFFVLKIPSIIGFLSGSTARKAVLEIQESGKSHRSSGNKRKNKAKLTEEMLKSTTFAKPDTDHNINGVTTAKLNSQEHKIKSQFSNTSGETSVLENDQGMIKGSEEYGTVVSDCGYTEQTTVLSSETVVLQEPVDVNASEFNIRTQILLFVSNEIIA